MSKQQDQSLEENFINEGEESLSSSDDTISKLASIYDAIEEGDLVTLENELINFPNINEIIDEEGNSLIHIAIEVENIEIVSFLIKKQINLNLTNNNNIPALYIAIHIKNFELTELLIENGADVNFQTYNLSLTPLHFAMSLNNFKIINLLIEKGSNIDAKDSYGLAPLHYACINNYIEGVQLLINNKANINIKDNDNLTPLHLAVRCNNFEIVKLLVENAANINAQYKDFTPCDIAFYNKFSEIENYLIANGAIITLAEFIIELSNGMVIRDYSKFKGQREFANLNEEEINELIQYIEKTPDILGLDSPL